MAERWAAGVFFVHTRSFARSEAFSSPWSCSGFFFVWPGGAAAGAITFSALSSAAGGFLLAAVLRGCSSWKRHPERNYQGDAQLHVALPFEY